MKILHVLANSPPDVNGYAIRTHGLLRAYSSYSSIEVVGLTSPWYPDRDTMVEPVEMDGVRYHRCLHPARQDSVRGIGMKWISARAKARIGGNGGFANKSFLKRAMQLALKPLRPGFSWIEEKIIFRYFEQQIINTAVSENASVIHAHVPYRVGIPAFRAARKLNLPFVYEMRGMWEESAVASGRWKTGGLGYKRFRRLETNLLRKADSVICISETLRQEAIARGVNPNKIVVVPNAINPDFEEYEHELYPKMKELLSGKPVVGYIGSLRELEGVDLTAEAISHLKSRKIDANFFVLTSESGQDELRKYCQALDISDRSFVVGPVPHKQVNPFYGLIDVFVVSRPDLRVTRLVTPLKPFEAMRAGCAVLVSDLPALSEIVTDGVTGRLFSAGDAVELANCIEELCHDTNQRKQLGQAAKSWVEDNRTWPSVIESVPNMYDALIK